MNSSISNSDGSSRRRTLWRALIFVAMVFIGLELFTRRVLLPNSRDFARFDDYPKHAEVLCKQSGLRIAFVGNSATQRGIDAKQFCAELPHPKDALVTADSFLADGSMINTWHYLVKDLFWRHHRNPDWIVIHFFESCLADGHRLEIGRLALYFTQSDDWRELCEIDLPTYGDRVEYLLSTTWATYAVRDRIKKRVMNILVPGYKEFAEELNAHQLNQENNASSTASETYRALERFLDIAKKNQTKVCFVAFPTNRLNRAVPYELDDDALNLIRGYGMRFIDLRIISALQVQHYEDPIHLTPVGAAIYTRHFAIAFAAIMAND